MAKTTGDRTAEPNDTIPSGFFSALTEVIVAMTNAMLHTTEGKAHWVHGTNGVVLYNGDLALVPSGYWSTAPNLSFDVWQAQVENAVREVLVSYDSDGWYNFHLNGLNALLQQFAPRQ